MGRSNRRKIEILKELKPYALILPLVVFYLVFIGGGFIEVLKESFGYIPVLGFNTVSYQAFIDILAKKDFIINLVFSIYLALSSCLISTFLGILIAYSFVMTNNKYLKFVTKKVIQGGIIIPYLYGVFIAMLFFTKTGFISRVFYHVGIIKNFETFPELIFDRFGIGIILVYVFKGTPFIALFLINVMSRISDTYSGVAKTLGAKDVIILKKIYLPLSSNTIIWASSIIFAYDLGSFEVPYLLSSIYPVPLSSSLYSLFINPNISEIPSAMAMNVIIFIIGIVVILIYAFSLKLILTRRVK